MKLKTSSSLSSLAAPVAVLFICLAIAPRPASAAEVAGNGATNAPTQLPVVTVTAQKEPEPAQSLPLSVTAVTQPSLQEGNIHTVKEASIYSPNSFINEFTAPAVSNPFFRGIGGGPLNPGVTTFSDGVPQLNSYSSSIQFVDIDQVEFVRGPQGALFGRNTAGGLINISSTRPANVWSSYAEGSYGNYNLGDVRGTVSGPIAKDELALSLSGGYTTRDGYTKNDFTGDNLDRRNDEFGKGQLLYKVNDRLELRLIASGEHDHDGDYALGDLNYIRANPNHVSRDFEGFNHRDVVSGTLLANYYGDVVDLASISGVVWWRNEGLTDLDYSPAPGNLRDNFEEQHQFTQEFRISSAKDKPLRLADSLELGWQSGLFLFSQSYDQNAVNTLSPAFTGAPFPVNSQSTSDLDDLGLGVYGQAKLTAWEKLDLTAGVRFDYEHKQADLGSATSPALTAPSQAGLGDHFSQVSPQFGLAYHFTSNQTVYASAARGYRAGGFNPVAPPGGQEYGAEHTWNYEVGYKSRWLDGKLEATAALFYIDWRDLQLNQPVATSPGQFFVANAGGVDSKGVEFELKYRPIATWDLFGGVGYDQAKFLGGSTAYNPNLPPAGIGANQSVGGNTLPYTPSFTGNMGSQLSWSPCQQATLYARAEVTVYGDFQYDASNAASQPTYSVADFRVGARGYHWFAEGWVRNAFDTHYVPIAIQYGQLGAPSGYVGETGAPVTFGLRAGLFF